MEKKIEKTYVADTLLPLADVENIAGFKKSKIYKMMADGEFPLPVRLGKRSVRWKSSSLNSWINGL
jgi:prophage regulatory protein